MDTSPTPATAPALRPEDGLVLRRLEQSLAACKAQVDGRRPAPKPKDTVPEPPSPPRPARGSTLSPQRSAAVVPPPAVPPPAPPAVPKLKLSDSVGARRSVVEARLLQTGSVSGSVHVGPVSPRRLSPLPVRPGPTPVVGEAQLLRVDDFRCPADYVRAQIAALRQSQIADVVQDEAPESPLDTPASPAGAPATPAEPYHAVFEKTAKRRAREARRQRFLGIEGRPDYVTTNMMLVQGLTPAAVRAGRAAHGASLSTAARLQGEALRAWVARRRVDPAVRLRQEYRLTLKLKAQRLAVGAASRVTDADRVLFEDSDSDLSGCDMALEADTRIAAEGRATAWLPLLLHGAALEAFRRPLVALADARRQRVERFAARDLRLHQVEASWARVRRVLRRYVAAFRERRYAAPLGIVVHLLRRHQRVQTVVSRVLQYKAWVVTAQRQVRAWLVARHCRRQLVLLQWAKAEAAALGVRYSVTVAPQRLRIIVPLNADGAHALNSLSSSTVASADYSPAGSRRHSRLLRPRTRSVLGGPSTYAEVPAYAWGPAQGCPVEHRAPVIDAEVTDMMRRRAKDCVTYAHRLVTFRRDHARHVRFAEQAATSTPPAPPLLPAARLLLPPDTLAAHVASGLAAAPKLERSVDRRGSMFGAPRVLAAAREADGGRRGRFLGDGPVQGKQPLATPAASPPAAPPAPPPVTPRPPPASVPKPKRPQHPSPIMPPTPSGEPSTADGNDRPQRYTGPPRSEAFFAALLGFDTVARYRRFVAGNAPVHPAEIAKRIALDEGRHGKGQAATAPGRTAAPSLRDVTRSLAKARAEPGAIETRPNPDTVACRKQRLQREAAEEERRRAEVAEAEAASVEADRAELNRRFGSDRQAALIAQCEGPARPVSPRDVATPQRKPRLPKPRKMAAPASARMPPALPMEAAPSVPRSARALAFRRPSSPASTAPLPSPQRPRQNSTVRGAMREGLAVQALHHHRRAMSRTGAPTPKASTKASAKASTKALPQKSRASSGAARAVPPVGHPAGMGKLWAGATLQPRAPTTAGLGAKAEPISTPRVTRPVPTLAPLTIGADSTAPLAVALLGGALDSVAAR